MSLLVKDVMSSKLFTIFPQNTVLEAKIIMKKHGISALPVINRKSELVGIISIGDVIKAIDESALEDLIEKRMSEKVIAVNYNEPAVKALEYFRKYKYERLPVVDENNCVKGMITTSNILKNFFKYLSLDQIVFPEIQKEFQEQELYFDLKPGDFTFSGVASSNLKKTLESMGFDEDVIRRSAITAYEAEMNVVIHSEGGFMNAFIKEDRVIIKVYDRGPGIEDLKKAMTKGYSTASDEVRSMGFGAGMGLPNIKKYSNKFKIKSSREFGTKLLIEIEKRQG